MKVSDALALALLMTSVTSTVGSAADVLRPGVAAKLSGEIIYYDVSGGALSRARNETTNKNFTAETGVKIKADFNPDMTKFFAAEESGAPIPWSVVELGTTGDFIRARDGGFLEKLDPAIVPFANLQDGTYSEYGVEVFRYGIVLTYNTQKFSGKDAPTSALDIFDTKRFPGKRCLFKYPQFGGVLETALLADGVTRDKLYPLDVDRALKKLDVIKSDILWWGNGDEAIRLLSSGECSIGIAWTGRVYGAVKNDKAPLAIEWQDSLYATGSYAIPKGAPNAAAGQAFIAHFISDLAGQKALVEKITYTTDLKALSLSDYGPALVPWLPAGANANKAIKEDASYYSKNLPAVLDRFNRWLATN